MPRRTPQARDDPAAFASLYEHHQQELYRYCRSLLHHHDDARDALQSTMANAYAALRDEERDFELRPWLFRIAHNESISLLRQRRTTSLDQLPELAGAELEADVDRRRALAELREDLAALTARQRSALVLRELSGLSHAEIGAALDTTPRATKQLIFEARSALHEIRHARDMACAPVLRALSDGDGRVLRGRRVRAHVRTCGRCQTFAAALTARPRELAALAPALPLAGGAGLIAHGLGAGHAAAGAASGTAAGAGAVASSSSGGLAALVGGKGLVVLAVAATATGGAAAVAPHDPASRPTTSAPAVAAPPATVVATPATVDVPKPPKPARAPKAQKHAPKNANATPKGNTHGKPDPKPKPVPPGKAHATPKADPPAGPPPRRPPIPHPRTSAAPAARPTPTRTSPRRPAAPPAARPPARGSPRPRSTRLRSAPRSPGRRRRAAPAGARPP
ncbi:RNA polymerase sigma factor [Baekduia alba]|nr:RNA polymerase sigma factor [Baekduia alba]